MKQSATVSHRTCILLYNQVAVHVIPDGYAVLVFLKLFRGRLLLHDLVAVGVVID